MSVSRTALCLTLMLLAVSYVSASDKLSPSLRARISENPKESVRVIVLTEDAASVKGVLSDGVVPGRLYSIISGYSAELTPSQIMAVQARPGVKGVFLDGFLSVLDSGVDEVGVRLDSSVDSIGAGFVHQQLNVTGRNVTVAVVDTGINYMHPDLGGCFGPGCRVRGGYDFYFNDADPADNHAGTHGTHVAGIIGASGGITGVAPDVSFYALAVCRPDGYVCWDSDIIAAIDWAVAHDADVISISLGGPYQPNDEIGPLEQAVDEAVEKGLVVSIAAGNIGSGASTIEHPASAGNAITVGNVNDKGTPHTWDDSMAGPSSRGPSAFGRLDPDVSAPGSSIRSTMYTNSYGTKSGTSMAAPHVSGAAALMLERDHSLTPQDIRARFIHTAEGIPGHLFEKGGGELNVSRAMLSTLNASVEGGDRLEALVHGGEEKAVVFSVQNSGNESINITVSLEQFSDLKLNSVLDTSGFSLPATSIVSAGNTITLQVNATVAQDASPAVYGGFFVLTSDDGQVLHIPAVLSVPLVGSGTASGIVSLAGLDSGDWIYVPLVPTAKHGLTLNLSWSGGADLDLFLLAPNGEFVNASNSSSNPEVLSAGNLTYETYWALVHASSTSGATYFNLSADYQGNLSVSPPYFSGVYGGSIQQLTFNVSNDASPKQEVELNLLEVQDSPPAGWTMEESIYKTNGDAREYYYPNISCARHWFKSDFNMTLDDARLADVSLSWNMSHNLDLYLVFWDDDGDRVFEAGEDSETRFFSMHDNTVSGSSVEALSRADIQYYINTYHDVGVGVCNVNNVTAFDGNVTINVTLYTLQEFPYAQVSPQQINLSAGETKNVTITVNMTGMQRGEKHNTILFVGEYAQVPIDFESGAPTAPTINPLQEYSPANLTLSWSPSISPGDIEYYTLEYSVNQSFNPKEAVNSTGTQANLTLTHGAYYFRVKAVDSSQFESPYSNTVNTTVDATGPTTPQLIYPLGVTLDYTPTLNWSDAFDSSSGLSHYMLQVSDEPSYTNLTLNESKLGSVHANTSFADGLYYVRVRAFDNAGNAGNFSPEGNFTVSTVRLNELQPTAGQWIELYNTRSEPVNLTGWIIRSSQGNKTLAEAIPARGVLLYNSTQLNLTLSSANDTIQLKNPKTALIDSVNYATIPDESSYGRDADGVGDWVIYNSTAKTPGLRNYQTLPVTLRATWNLISLPLVIY